MLSNSDSTKNRYLETIINSDTIPPIFQFVGTEVVLQPLLIIS